MKKIIEKIRTKFSNNKNLVKEESAEVTYSMINVTFISSKGERIRYSVYKELLSKLIKSGGRVGRTYDDELFCVSDDEEIRGKIFGLKI